MSPTARARALEAVDEPELHESADDELEPAQAMQAEVAAEPDDGSVLVELVVGDRGAPIRVPPVDDWKPRAQRMLANGFFDEWVEVVLSDEDADAWFALDPTNRQVRAFFDAWEKTSGQAVGESRASRRSSRSTARR